MTRLSINEYGMSLKIFRDFWSYCICIHGLQRVDDMGLYNVLLKVKNFGGSNLRYLCGCYFYTATWFEFIK